MSFFDQDKVFIIAEMSGNHNQSLARALDIVDAAAEAGADALKLQTYTADTMTIDCDKSDFIVDDENSLWAGERLYDLYQKASTPWDWHKAIFERCKEKGMVPLSTPFDSTAVDFLEELGSTVYKIASFENTDIPLIKKIAQTRKPVIISSGMATLDELIESVKALKENGCPKIILLKCTSAYPASAENSNLATIFELKKQFPECIIGLSDHTLGIGVSIASVALGAKVIEKHFTLARADGGVDSDFSMEPSELRQLVDEVRRVERAIGIVCYGAGQSEKKSLIFRRSVYAVKDIRKGEEFSSANVRVIRPGYGLAPKYIEQILGKKSKNNIERGTVIKLEDF